MTLSLSIFRNLARPAIELHLHFTYQGSVLADAGNGLLYVGAHGTWYPNSA